MLLHKAGIPFEVYERATEIEPLGASMYFNSTTANFFKFGAGGYILARPQLHALLLRQVPHERVHMGKKVLSIESGDHEVMVRFNDGTEAEGDILVRADGAYSAVFQNLYEKLKRNDKLPPSDAFSFPITHPLTPEEFPDLALHDCQFRKYIDTSIVYAIKDFPIISGGDKILTFQDLMDRTPKIQMTKVMLEEKVFRTWYDCRTVLIGDACHKFNPQGGVGATNAMHDAIVLANLINGLPFHPVAEEIEAAFKAYQDERFQWVLDAFNSSKVHRTMMGQRIQEKTCSYRPQVAFLPLIKNTGRVHPAQQPSLSVQASVKNEEKSAAQSV
ncbi:FAD/NAD(P)-binding domain-containing protein [Linnemannia elongata AG-77]|uniref:FAD/NAD(P)-binding domain-containing protein n=1 Tax=Linnemannia elongata AG-77 TaxID=1314771 RepID=A0A197JX03_9FUNG|nr:FAD/NAD(P)-binding domain-containing protein [Linnemannia elongata AG-77]